jgi:glutaminase
MATAFLFLANGGINPLTGKEVIGKRDTKRINALMMTCGMYNESGDFAYRVGMPGKSGVGGGIVAIIPGQLSIAVWSPELNAHGNSYRGIATLEDFTTELGISVF